MQETKARPASRRLTVLLSLVHPHSHCQPGSSNGSVCWKCHIASVAIARMRPTPEAIKEADGLPIGIRSGIRRGGYGKGSYGKGVSGFGFGKGKDKPMHQSILSMVPKCTRNMHEGI